ncbi:TatD family hydrolase [Cerasicoccus arenae]|uniref:TatD family hydrolase n=1 Tax=Cerasicoccus arenae TaxID=424488 RepID=A0A8J3GDV0_9BACT|nr:TatD family hydrolase [Cerasicoccus arenae]MBK1858706.1 TatD family hydrolase [Cerasicoccus arenae]GHB98420.1 TatD family hydrolase [Cerasicoccus arenae]
MSDAPLYDAHCHWHDQRLNPGQELMVAGLAQIPLAKAVVNGTHPGDWEAVAELAEQDSRVLPAFGLHPWHVNEAPKDWLDQLQDYLHRFPYAAVGEAGLDRWIQGHDLPRQQAALQAQMELAAAENRPISLHCLQAWGPLFEQLQAGPLPARGFHLHGYGGAPEMVASFAAIGGYFSFSAYVMHERKARHRESFAVIPIERLLLETDSPDMLPSVDWLDWELTGNAVFADEGGGRAMHHPANITASYRAASKLTGMPESAIRLQVERNFHRFFLEA